jgi:uncharacterized DUF497 family protein
MLVLMAKFRFIQWLVEWLLSQESFQFEWDQGNRTKSQQKHKVALEEIEEVFAMAEAIRALGEQFKPAAPEPRFGILGVTKQGRHLFICFTLRGSGIRVISSREMSKKERKLYVELCEE